MLKSSLLSAYYKNEEDSKNSFTEDGWFRTGDIGALLQNGNALKIIDRKGWVFKVGSGDYVAPGRIESACKFYEIVENIFVYGNN